MSEPAEVVAETMKRYSNLSGEFSFQDDDILPEGEMDRKWRDLLITYADRFVVGTNTNVNVRWVEYVDLVDAHWAWLCLLPRVAARAIAVENTERVFGREYLRPFHRNDRLLKSGASQADSAAVGWFGSGLSGVF